MLHRYIRAKRIDCMHNMLVCMCVCVHACTCMCMYVRARLCVCLYMCVRAQARAFVCMHACVCLCMGVRACRSVCVIIPLSCCLLEVGGLLSNLRVKCWVCWSAGQSLVYQYQHEDTKRTVVNKKIHTSPAQLAREPAAVCEWISSRRGTEECGYCLTEGPSYQ